MQRNDKLYCNDELISNKLVVAYSIDIEKDDFAQCEVRVGPLDNKPDISLTDNIRAIVSDESLVIKLKNTTKIAYRSIDGQLTIESENIEMINEEYR